LLAASFAGERKEMREVCGLWLARTWLAVEERKKANGSEQEEEQSSRKWDALWSGPDRRKMNRATEERRETQMRQAGQRAEEMQGRRRRGSMALHKGQIFAGSRGAECEESERRRSSEHEQHGNSAASHCRCSRAVVYSRLLHRSRAWGGRGACY
jgi:hypothetical protein